MQSRGGFLFLGMALNIEIKARMSHAEFFRSYLNSKGEFKGTDFQADTYFNVPNGRLKLREGNIENNLIYYERQNTPGAKESSFQLVHIQDPKSLKEILSAALGVKIVVRKKREIYFIKNVKFHIDDVEGLGNFAEIEASDLYTDLSKEELQKQCDFYLRELKIREEDLVSVSYSDMLFTLNK
jgi:predicted adenylyl cyclase CyaB